MADDFTAEKLSKMDAAADDERLTDLDFRLFWKMASAADKATAVARRKQSWYADALNVSRRAVQLSMDRLSAYGYVAPKTTTATGSRAYVNAFEIAPKANLCSHYTSEPTFVSRKKKRTAVQKQANRGSETSEPSFAHVPLYSLDVPSRARGPSRPKGLGPLAAPLRARIGSTDFNAWFVGAGIAESTEDSVTIELPSPFKAQQAENRFGRAVLACLQAQQSTIERVKFIGRLAA
jgi:hypothetical protein